MSDRYPSEIEIGGKVPRSKMEGLIQAINCQECSGDWGDKYISLPNPEDEPPEVLAAAIQELLKFVTSENGKGIAKNTLWFCDEEASWGELTEIEEYCVENDIGFRRRSSSYGEYSSEIKEFRQGMKVYDVYTTDNEGHPIINGTFVKALVEKAEALLKEGATQLTLTDLQKATETVRHLLPVEVAELEPFEIIEELES